MAFRYVVKKRMVGIGTKTEKYVAASYSVANIDFDRLCDQVTCLLYTSDAADEL